MRANKADAVAAGEDQGEGVRWQQAVCVGDTSDPAAEQHSESAEAGADERCRRAPPGRGGVQVPGP